MQQIEVAGRADFQIPCARDGGIGIDQPHWVQQGATIVALIPPRPLEIANRTGAFDIAIRQEPPIGGGVDHFVEPLFDQALFFQGGGEVLR